MSALRWLFDAQISFGEQHILWREVIGNAFGLASALGGMRRRIWAWPVGIVGNVLLFTVFLGAVFDTPQKANLLGQAGRQVMFVLVSVYGWWRWQQSRRQGQGEAVTPHWASWRERGLLVAAAVAGTLLLTPLFRALGSFEPVWADAWIFTGSVLATWGMARGWVEFWLVWIAVDAVGVPLLLRAHLYPSAVLYLFYGGFCVVGFVVWLRTRARLAAQPTSPSIEAVA